MVSSSWLISAFKDTQRTIRENETLRNSTIAMQAGTRLYLQGFEAISPEIKARVPDIEICEDTTFHCCQTYLSSQDPADDLRKVGALNFANAYTPGGGVLHGAMAQEECLCRSSNLYESLTIPYIRKNYYKWNAKYTGDMGTDAVVYSPRVTVFRTDDPIPVDMDSWFQVDVLTCAAPYYDPYKRRPVSREALAGVFDKRVKNILEVAAANGIDVLVLGAFGCGAFNNPADMVAEVFRNLLCERGYGRFFEKVLFAIKKNDQANTNLQAFQRAFDSR